MMSESEHSPLPWSHGTDEDGSVIYDESLGYVADVGNDDGEVELEDANRDFIIRACNSHYNLLGVLEALVADWSECVRTQYQIPEEIGNCSHWDAAIAAIAKAKGETR